jgi:hypothetical protein
MSGEPQPQDRGDKLDRALFALKAVWFGLFSGGLIISILVAAIVMSGGGAIVDLGVLAYLFLLAVPLGLLGAYVIAPLMSPTDPAAVVRSAPGKGGTTYSEWEGTKPDEAYYWFPAYASAFFIRASMLEGTAIISAIGFFVTGEWAVLGGAAVLLAALVAQMPTRSAAEAFAANAQSTQAGGNQDV